MNVYSHSRLSSFENCPRKFAFRYIEQVETQCESVEAFLGKRVHEILERLYHHVRLHGRPPSLAQVQARFRQDWRAQWHPQVRIARAENDVEHYQRYGDRCLEHYYRAEYPFDHGETVGIEQQVQIELDPPAGRYRMRGIIDRVVQTRDGRYEIHDYKTSGTLPPLSRLAGDRQLALYQIGIEQSYPDAREVELVWHYLGFGKTLRVRRTAEDLISLRKSTMERIDQIEAASEFPARTGPLCRWCEYAEICPAVGGTPPPLPQPEPPNASPAAPACPRGQLSLF